MPWQLLRTVREYTHLYFLPQEIKKGSTSYVSQHEGLRLPTNTDTGRPPKEPNTHVFVYSQSMQI